MEAERGRQEGRGGGGSGDQAMKEDAAEQTSRREGGDKGRQQEQTENPSSKADATASGWEFECIYSISFINSMYDVPGISYYTMHVVRSTQK